MKTMLLQFPFFHLGNCLWKSIGKFAYIKLLLFNHKIILLWWYHLTQTIFSTITNNFTSRPTHNILKLLSKTYFSTPNKSLFVFLVITLILFFNCFFTPFILFFQLMKNCKINWHLSHKSICFSVSMWFLTWNVYCIFHRKCLISFE